MQKIFCIFIVNLQGYFFVHANFNPNPTPERLRRLRVCAVATPVRREAPARGGGLASVKARLTTPFSTTPTISAQ